MLTDSGTREIGTRALSSSGCGRWFAVGDGARLWYRSADEDVQDARGARRALLRRGRANDAVAGLSRAGGGADVRLRAAVRARAQVAQVHELAYPRGNGALRGR